MELSWLCHLTELLQIGEFIDHPEVDRALEVIAKIKREKGERAVLTSDLLPKPILSLTKYQRKQSDWEILEFWTRDQIYELIRTYS